MNWDLEQNGDNHRVMATLKFLYGDEKTSLMDSAAVLLGGVKIEVNFLILEYLHK